MDTPQKVPSNSPLKAQPPRSKKKRRLLRRVVVCCILMLVMVNVLAFIQARAMTHFVSAGGRTPAPETLTRLQKVWVLLTGVNVPRPQNSSTPADVGLAFKTSRVVAADADLEIWNVPADAVPKGLVLMYHAYVSSKQSLLAAAAEFHQLGYDVQMVDFRGSGGSTGNSTTVGYREADEVVTTFREARRDHPQQKIILFGQSMGAAAILRATGDLDISPDAIILESPFDRLLSTAENRFRAMHLPAFPMAQLLIFWGGVQDGHWGFELKPEQSATRVRCPALMFHGQLDSRVTPEQARLIFDHLAGPKQLEWYTTAGHCGFLSSDTPRWRAAVTKLLKL